MNDEYYRFNNVHDEDLSVILRAFNISIFNKLYKRADLKHKNLGIKI